MFSLALNQTAISKNEPRNNTNEITKSHETPDLGTFVWVRDFVRAISWFAPYAGQYDGLLKLNHFGAGSYSSAFPFPAKCVLASLNDKGCA